MAPIADLLSSAGQAAVERAAAAVLDPTRTLPLARRQTTSGATATVTVVQTQASTANSGNSASTLSGGAIAGIVIGSIVGVLLLIWIFRSCSNMGAPPVRGENPSGRAWYDGVQAEPYPPSSRGSHSRHRSRSRHHHHGGHGRRPSSAEVQEVREYKTAVPVVAPPAAYVYESDARRSRRGRSRDHRSRSASRY